MMTRDEGEEEEPSEDHTEDHSSEASTRSRSRHGAERGFRPSPTSDHSYEGHLKQTAMTLDVSCQAFCAWTIPPDVLSYIGQGIHWPLFTDLSAALDKDPAPPWLTYTGMPIEHKLSDGPPSVPTSRGQEAAAHDPARPDRPLDAEELPAGLPVFTAPRPAAVPALLQPERLVDVTVLLYAFEYAPEQVRIRVAIPISAEHFGALVQTDRCDSARQRFPSMTPVRPQPAIEYATYLVAPDWSTDIYVLFDLTRINGTMHSAYVASALDRESILVIAELDRSAQVAVYGPDSLGPLRPGEIVQLQLGDCLTFAPTDHDWFVVATLGDMLQGHEGWRDLAEPPVAPGRWLHILTDAEPCRFLLHDARRLQLREDIAATIGTALASLTVCPAVPRISDHLDRGVLARTVAVATNVLDRRGPYPDPRVPYLLDMRPICCGLTWGLAHHGRLWLQPIIGRCDSFWPGQLSYPIDRGPGFSHRRRTLLCH